ncbi:hypothetical protein E4T52_00352 [Aureobasidium sp. EXF-3400]|nr:hypothetical protein E4T51_02327 [Aureobasidium sp. EXF-12344]KAI4784768.1 hypothetical protein E4T52_00352 [Aureobasidium sp. EXF-3400]
MDSADVAAPPQPGLVSALPTMLMSYFTTPTTPDKTSLNESRDANTKSHQQNNFTTESLPMQHDTPLSQRNNPNRSSLPLMSTDDGYASREGSLMSSNGGRKKRSSRPKTSYSIAHAPPKGSARHKIHVRAKPLLQLHQLSQSARPMPAYELLPSAIFSPSLSRAISKTLRTRHGHCPADLAIVKAEKYHQHEASPKEEDESRDVLALVCKGRKGDGNTTSKAKLFLEDGSEWEAYSLPNGGYEFFSTDAHGLGMTARWVLRRPKARRSQSASDMTTSWGIDGANQNKKFNFSTISPNSRRHPVIASLTTTSLDINDSYTIPSALAPSPEISDHEQEQEEAGQDAVGSTEPIVTPQSLKALITATAIWVTLREGWCPGYRYDDLMLRSPSLKLNASPIKSPTDLSSIASPKEDSPRRSGSIARMFRSAGVKRRSTSSQIDGSTSTEEVPITRSASARRARADSTSTVLIHSKRPRGRRADTTSTTASGLAHMDLAPNDMTEEEESVEATAAMLAKSSKHSSAPTPLIPALDLQESDEEGYAVRTDSAKSQEAERKLAAVAAQRQKRESSTTSANSIDAGKIEANMPRKAKKPSLFRKLFCGMAG